MTKLELDSNVHILCTMMWQLILRVSLTGPQGAQMFGQILLCVFLDKFNIESNRLNKADCSP